MVKAGKEAKAKSVKLTDEQYVDFETSVLKRLIKSAEGFVDEIFLEFGDNEVTTLAVDPSHVAMFSFTLPCETATLKEKPYKLGLNLDKLDVVVKKLGKDEDEIRMHIKDNKTIQFTVGRFRRTLSPISLEGEVEPKVPKLNLPATIKCKASVFRDDIKTVSDLYDHMAIMYRKEGVLSIKAEDEIDSIELDIGSDKVEMSGGKDERSLFPSDYLQNILKALEASDDIVMQMGTDYPIKIAWTDSSGSMTGEFLLAPRIETD